MDPTKSFDHLDPKLKETYARVMGTAPAADPLSTTPPASYPPQSPTDLSQPQFTAAPLDPTVNPTLSEGPNPGTGPTINTMPTDTTTMFAPTETAAPTAPLSDANSPATSSFFSSPSPATTDPSQVDGNNLAAPVMPPSEPASAPVTPYTAENPTAGQMAAPAEQFSQPLPSPSSVAQAAPHETSALLRVLYILAAAIFFAIYTVFWIKVFNLPFLF